MKKSILAILFCLFIGSLLAQTNKIPLSHADYDHWKNLKNQQISANGEWITYEVNPQKGDGYLYLYQVSTGKLDSVARGYQAIFSPESEILSFNIKAQFDTIRQAKVKKIEKKDLPKDSLGIWNLKENSILHFAELESFKIREEKGEWMAFLLKMPKEKKDSLANDSIEKPETKTKGEKDAKNKEKIEKGELVILNFLSGKEYRYKDVSDYALSENGNAVTFVQVEGDSIQTSKVNWFTANKEQVKTVFEQEGIAKKTSLAPNGDQLSFIFSADTLKNKTFALYYQNIKLNELKVLVDTLSKDIQKDWTVSENGEIYFSKNGEKLFFGVAPRPINEPKDTLLDEEKYHVDVWNWKDPLLQPQQKVQAEKEKKRTWLAVYNPLENKVLQLGNENLPDVKLYDDGNSKLALGSSSLPYQQLTSWDDWYSDYYVIDTKTGKKDMVLEKKNSRVNISPAQKFLIWFETQDSIWYSYQIENRKTVALTKKIKANFYDETHDTPSDPSPYGVVGWTKGDEEVIISDRYDFWKLDPTGVKSSENITNSFGRRNKIRFDYVKLNEEELFIDLEKPVLLSAFHEFTKKSGFYRLQQDEEPEELVFEDAGFNSPLKAKKANQLIWKRSTFKDYPNLWTGNMRFTNPKQVSDANPQQKNYLWGDVELVKWTSGDGEELQGLLYKPENFDPNKKYPMLVYFYERSSDALHRHHVPKPNWSIINPSYCVSNDYLIFMPDITYHKVGYPGECAYSAVVTGTLSMMDRYSFIDKENIGLQGQSWGGYQIAYLVTRTNLFKCAMAGAPVSNMTSAYGGIRWGTGMSRMFQYEHTQSRIGGTLWNSTLQYIENSPIFYAPKIETPLLMMHNDHDGAVPWYQGIELFVAMRRLQKPCWLLSYNDEDHNLKKRPNRVDLSIRTMQFFDFYLKGKPAPEWMVDGIPAIEKGITDGYDLKK
ncbi:alpha/beta hydrolase family protein [Labilibaculum euxinus]|uniref:Prolyl oligopeptidase family serine peptidase n=1 Tax=Labilibaculum euxinus TaxID=2686357 RepID=A0A7M4D2C2_9BACT|nr:prolyl oligopeptidase family serine peptidase [Labilibaculum euxinus]MUP36801.1 prolyl oligopeptidase family serine peptidase [Labilibaculum euxinus]MVB06006.1 prolyl oligopeptidase family serine peptidase [Labilibaculum euxinus]